jgi:TonB family protein
LSQTESKDLRLHFGTYAMNFRLTTLGNIIPDRAVDHHPSTASIRQPSAISVAIPSAETIAKEVSSPEVTMTPPNSARLKSEAAVPAGAVFFATVTLDSRTHTNPWAIGTSTALNGALIALLLILGFQTSRNHFPPATPLSHISLSDFPLFAPATPQANNGGSGGGSHDLVDPSRGNPPKFTATPLAPPIVQTIVDPKLAVEPASVSLPSDPSLPNLGVAHSPNITILSNGQGGPVGIGTGKNGPYGPGTGPGGVYGPGDGIYPPGSGVSAPILIYAPMAEFSDEARRNKYQGVCMISLIVDAQGIPRNPIVIQTLGEGLDQKALEAIPRYKFKPGMKNGRPVATRIIVEVNFRLF